MQERYFTVHVDAHELDQLDRDILKLVDETMPNELKKFMRREGGRAATATRRTARGTVKKKTGNYFRSIKASRAWRNSAGGYGDKVYSTAPHAHLLEYGHRIVTHTGRDTGKKTRAFEIMSKGIQSFEGRFYADTEVFIGQMVEKGLG